MSDLGLPVASALRVDEDTLVTVRMVSGVPELLIYTPFSFGGDEVHQWPAESGTINDRGAFGRGISLGPFNATRREYEFFYCYLFGAGQGPIRDIRLSDPAARWKLTNPEIDGWVIVIPNDEDFMELEWVLIGGDGGVIHSGIGFPGPCV
jgi:hypothetical protein